MTTLRPPAYIVWSTDQIDLAMRIMTDQDFR